MPAIRLERGPRISFRFDPALLLQARGVANLTQEQLAHEAGIAVQTLGRAERGDPVSLETARAIAAVLDVPVERLLAQTSDAASIHPGSPSWLELPLFSWDPLMSPAGLLRADVADGVPFHGRTAELADFDAWCADEMSLSVRLYIGPGGMGKTRFMIEACSRWAERNWRTGFLTERTTSIAGEAFEADFAAWPRLVIVVDYAEGRLDLLRSMLRAAIRSRRDHRFRVVLLARNKGDWWHGLKATSDGVDALVQGKAAATIRLRPFASTLRDRTEAFQVAGEALSRRLGTTFVDQHLPDLDQESFERVLLIHMSALGQSLGTQLTGEAGILSFLLGRERRYWERLIRDRSLSKTLVPAVSLAVATVFAKGCVQTETDAASLLKAVPLLADQPETVRYAVAELLHDGYGGKLWIDRLQPDLLGEYLVAGQERRRPGSVLTAAMTLAKGGGVE